MFVVITIAVISIIAIIAVNNSPNHKQFVAVTTQLKNTNAIVTTTTSTITINSTINPNINSSKPQTYQKIKNLSSIYLYNKSGNLIGTYTTYIVNNVSIFLNASVAKPAQKIQINVTYNGIFNISGYFIKRTLGVHYFGYKEIGSNTMLVYINSLNATKYFKPVGLSLVHTPKNHNMDNFLEYTVNITPTEYARNKTWEFCGGSYVAYPINGWQKIFANVTLKNKTVSNNTVINVLSKKCKILQVN